ncbi:F0F1 ATP synthase subunit delta [Candidatus Nomurabacteria bacterium]|nr:F0F1 ATP synthase subunit delta [Candidatus Nomurabacteria bacterium]USN94966.1 MAG: F0F1 ATP synthase subunit delta [Candidatus Nomurabacteria bacterium]
MISSKKLASYIYKERDSKDFDNFLDKLFSVLKKNNLFKIIPKVLEEIYKIDEKEKKKNKIKLYTSHKFGDETIKKILQKYDIDPKETEIIEENELIGGFILENKGKLYDASIKTNIRKLEEEILRV